MTDVNTEDAAVEGAAPDELAAMAAMLLEHVNEQHDDSLLLLARSLGGQPGATSAQAVGLDRHGLDLTVVSGTPAPPPASEPGVRLRLLFPEPIDDPTGAQTAFFGLLTKARAQVGPGPLTALEKELARVAAIKTFLTVVVRVERLGPHFIQVTCADGDLREFEPVGPDSFVYVLAPPAGQQRLSIGRDFSWNDHPDLPEATRPVGAYYTVRRWRPESFEVDLIVEVHAGGGEGCAWAQRVAPGDPVALWGPRQAYEPPQDTDRYLLVGDGTALPAIGGILESLPPDTPVDVIVEVEDPSCELPLLIGPATSVRWLHRGDAPAGRIDELLTAVKEAAVTPTTYAWGGAESRAITAVRKHLRDERGLPATRVSMTGYWRRAGDEGGAAEEDDEG